jgi:hypothetical protein
MAALMRRLGVFQEAALWPRQTPHQIDLPAATKYHHRFSPLARLAKPLRGGEAASSSAHSPLPSRARESLGPTATPDLLDSAPRSPDPVRTRVHYVQATQSRPRSVYILAPGNQDIVGQGASHRASTSTVPRLRDEMSLPLRGINTRPAPPMRAYTPPLPDPDSSSVFLTDQIAKQQRSNFHSTSLRTVATMVSQSVNKTALHPKGVEYVQSLTTLKSYQRCRWLKF